MCSHRATVLQLNVSRQSHDRLDFRSHATAAKTDMETSNRMGREFPVPPMWIGVDDMTHGGKIGAFVESPPHPAWLASSDGICTYANPALQRSWWIGNGARY